MNPLLEIDMEIEEEMVLREENGEADEDEEAEAEKEEEEIDWEEILNYEDNFEFKLPRERRNEEIDRPEPAPVTLMDHLFEQLYLAPLSDEESKIGEYILGCINDAGYLAYDVEDIVEDLDKEPETVEKVLSVIQRFDPVGIAARNLQECLLIQLLDTEHGDELATRMIRECFEDFANKRFEKIANKMSITLEEVKRIMEVVSKLNPKPGERYLSKGENYITPDITLRKWMGNLLFISMIGTCPVFGSMNPTSYC